MLRISLIVTTALLSVPGSAAVFCVDSSAELLDALEAAAANGESDQIRLMAGHYIVPTSGSGFRYIQQDPDDLSLTGGWLELQGTPCMNQGFNPFDTVIDGQGSTQLLEILILPGTTAEDQPNRLEIGNLAFVNGVQTILSSAPVFVTDALASADLIIDRVFFGNNSGFAGAALSLQGLATVTVRNSVFQHNLAQEDNGTVLTSPAADSRGLYFINNTVIDNALNTTEPVACGGLCIEQPQADNDSYRAFIANNVLWNNAFTDLRVHFSVISYYFHNVVEEDSIFPIDQAHNRSLDPRLSTQPLDFTPISNSPLIDAGRPEPEPMGDLPFDQDWSLGPLDFHGGVIGRVFGDGVDIGAVESPYIDRMFSDRFQSGAGQ